MNLCKRLTAIALALAALTAQAAWGATNEPIQPYVSYQFMWDSNIFRLSGRDAAKAQLGSSNMGTVMHRVDAGIDADIPISRQHVVAQLNVNKSRFESFRFLDYTGHDVQIRWEWVVGDRWSGVAGYSNSRHLASYTQLQRPVQSLVTLSNRFVDADYNFLPHWHVHGKASRYEVAYSNDLQNASNVNLNSVEAGVDFISRADNSLGVQLKGTDGGYPNRQVVANSTVDNSYRQYEVNALASWKYSPNTRVAARLGYVRRTYHQLSVRDFKGLAGRASVYWHVGGSTVLRLSAWRRISAYQNLLSSYVINNGASLSPTWTVTPKLTVKGQVLYEALTYQGDPGFALDNTRVRRDHLHGAGLDVTYKPFDHLTLEASYDWRYRTSNYSTRSYRDNTINVQLRLDFL